MSVELARAFFGRVDKCRLLVVGAGEVAESALKLLNPDRKQSR